MASAPPLNDSGIGSIKSPPPERDTSGRRLWRHGTLVYTTAGLIMLFFWLLLGDFAFFIRERSAHPVVQLALKGYGASSTFQSYVLVFIPHAVALLLQPVIAFKSDRYRSRWGRRIPFLLWTTPLTFFSMIGLAYCPWLADRTFDLFGNTLPANIGAKELTLWFFAAFYFVFELACITSITLFTSLVNDVVPRAIIGRFYAAFRAVSLAPAIIFTSLLLKFAETHFTEILVGIGIVFGLGFTLMCLFVKEGEYPPSLDNRAQGNQGTGFFAAARCYWRECYHHSFYRWVFAAMIFATLSFQPFTNFRIVYAKSLNVELATYGKIEAISYTISFLIAFPVGILVDRFHPLRLGIATMAIYCLVTIFGAFLITGPTTFLAALMCHLLVSGTFLTSTAALGALLFPKVTFGQFTAATAVLVNLGSMSLAATQGPLLDATNNNYSITWMLGGILALTALVCLIVTYAKFNKLGGPKGYVAQT